MAQRVRVDVLDSSGNKVGAGPFGDQFVLGAQYSRELDAIGTFSVAVSATDPRAGILTAGREVQIFREGEGLCARGIVDKVETTVDASGSAAVVASGSTISRQLVWANTKLWMKFENATLASVVSTLLTGTGWSSGTLGSPSYNMAAKQFDGASIWQALDVTAQVFRYHLRENPLAKTIDIDAMGDTSGILLTQGGGVEKSSNPTVGLITNIGIHQESGDLWNSVIPLGGGSGVDQVTLKLATRSSPYTVLNASANGQTYYYLEDSASVTAYGRRQRVTMVKDAVPLANTLAGHQAIANGLYDIAATWLQRHKDPVTEYTVTAVGLQHINSGTERFKVGQKLQLVYNGVAVNDAGTKRAWISVNQQLWLMGFSRTFAPDGSDTWQLRVASVDRKPEDEEARTAELYQQFYAISVALKPYTYREIHGPKQASANTSYPVDLPVVFDGNVALLHKAALTVGVAKVRSNVSVVASGGSSSPTSAAGTSHTHTYSGGTNSAEATHTHGINSTTSNGGSNPAGTHTLGSIAEDWSLTTGSGGTGSTSSDGSGSTGAGSSHSHSTHQHGSYDAPTTFGNSAYAVTDYSGVGSEASHTHSGPLHSHSGPSHTHYYDSGSFTFLVSEPAHTHTISATTSAAGASHTHTYSGASNGNEASHTHTVTIAAHTHNLTYGIYEGSAPSTPAMTVTINGTDRTGALGGPWNAGFTVDITTYLVDANGQPLRQSNTIRIGSGELVDLEVTCRSLVTATSIIPV